ncbi:MAG: glucose-1-phosphate adenylyltransferase subunit GlgD [Ruminococcaceae bacterium]|nr:glucose-1-phosphate adenylyltransferase subunit GlgD [Oscillospiraceae bacterium]
MAASGIIFSNIHDNNIPELTRMRTIASVPFGCRYRFIDFTLSNMVNSNIYNISVITHLNYQSLMDHIGSGKDWDLARRSGGIKILPPFITAYADKAKSVYQTRLEALKGVSNAINRITDEYVVLSDCDVICNIDFNDMIEYHRKSGADMTFAVKKVALTKEAAKLNVIYNSDDDGRLTDVIAYPVNYEGEADITLNIIVMTTAYLRQIVAEAIAYDHVSLTRDVISRNLNRMNYRVYKYDGYFACISSLEDYFQHSMDLITNANARDSLFNVKNRPVYTKVRNSTPAYYSPSARVDSSMIADGCYIEGTVENSIIFRGVKIGRNATVKNCIIMQDTIVGDGAFLNYVITDKNAVIRDGTMLVGAESQPFYVSKGKMI